MKYRKLKTLILLKELHYWLEKKTVRRKLMSRNNCIRRLACSSPANDCRLHVRLTIHEQQQTNDHNHGRRRMAKTKVSENTPIILSLEFSQVNFGHQLF
jgi:hypothetical protein